MSSSDSTEGAAGPLVKDAPTLCAGCSAALCLRKQVINLALGNTESMFCLVCLGQESEQSAQSVLSSIMDYVKGRECFNKEWQRYPAVEYCPDPSGCFPGTCFSGKKEP